MGSVRAQVGKLAALQSRISTVLAFPLLLVDCRLHCRAGCRCNLRSGVPLRHRIWQRAFDAVASGLASNGYGARSPDGYNLASSFLAEMVLPAILVLVILESSDFSSPVGFAGVDIAPCLTVIHLVSIPITNTSVNPARSIGPALFAGSAALGQLWLFIVASLAGGTKAWKNV